MVVVDQVEPPEQLGIFSGVVRARKPGGSAPRGQWKEALQVINSVPAATGGACGPTAIFSNFPR